MQVKESIDDAPLAPVNKKADTPLFPFLRGLAAGRDLTAGEAAEFFRALTSAEADRAQIAAALTALAVKGETGEEIAAMAAVMREQMIKIAARQTHLLDIAGTGMSAAKTFNVSTAAAFVAAGAGLFVAKQSGRAQSSATGSADVLAALGVKISAAPRVAQTNLDGAGICVMFEPKFHPARRRVDDVRRALGFRTALDHLGLLANPAGASRQLIGVWHPALLGLLADAVARLGTNCTWIVRGADGLDEMTLAGETTVYEIRGREKREFRLAPEDFKLARAGVSHLTAGSVGESAAIVREVLAGRRRDEARSLVVLNAAAALLIDGRADDPAHAARLAAQSIDSGQALGKLERLIQTTNKK